MKVLRICLENYTRSLIGGDSQALAEFPKQFGGPPDVIVVGANLWDLARWKVGDRRKFRTRRQVHCEPGRPSASPVFGT